LELPPLPHCFPCHGPSLTVASGIPKLPIFLAFIITSVAEGYIVSIGNILRADETAVPIILPYGTVLPNDSGSAAVGYFPSLSTADLEVVDYEQILDDFVQFGGDDSELSMRAFVGADGFFDLRFFGSIPPGGNEFTDQNLFIFLHTTRQNLREVV
jgi:hypothetical protein